MNQELVDTINELSTEHATETFRKCCGSSWWCERMAGTRPFANGEAVDREADRQFDVMPREAWLEAFGSHPKIGDVNSLRMRFAGNKQWSSDEQAGVRDTSEQVLEELAAGNEAYEARFGYIFIVCASGLTAEEMLSRLKSRLDNDDATELQIAAGEQRKITHLRLDKLEIDE